MTLEELIRKWFIKDEALAGTLAQYAGSPAIFLSTAPADAQAGWDKKTQYPRIVYRVDMRADSERKTAGTLNVELMCDISGKLPEDIEPEIRRCMKDLLIQPENGSPYCFAWLRSESFELQEATNKSKRIVGSDIAFDILEYPDQITTEPDPVEAMNTFLKEKLPEAFIIGMDQTEEFRVATEDSPLVYVRVVSYETDRTTYALAWMNCKLAVHIIAPTADVRSKWTRYTSNWFSTEGEAVMPDDSPLLFKGVSANNSMDYLVTGQILLDAQYALARMRPESAPLRNAHFNE